MKKSFYILTVVVIVIVLAAAALLYQPLTQPNRQNHFYGFENGFNGWIAGADVPENPNTPGHPVNWTITIVDNVSSGGNKSVCLYLDSSQDDGTIWIQRKISVTPNAANNVNVTFQLWSHSESFNTLATVVGYIDTKNATNEGNFSNLGSANQVEGWKTYMLNVAIQADASGDAYVAVGISAVWETQLTYYIDDLTLDIN